VVGKGGIWGGAAGRVGREEVRSDVESKENLFSKKKLDFLIPKSANLDVLTEAVIPKSANLDVLTEAVTRMPFLSYPRTTHRSSY
jgi:hypothetical protein